MYTQTLRTNVMGRGTCIWPHVHNFRLLQGLHHGWGKKLVLWDLQLDKKLEIWDKQSETQKWEKWWRIRRSDKMQLGYGNW